MQYFFMVWIYGHLSIRRDSTRPGSFYRALADLDLHEGNREAELEHALAAVRVDPKDAELRYRLATRLSVEKRLDEPAIESRELARLRPDFAGAWQGLGVIEKWRGAPSASIPHFRKAAGLAGALATVGQTRRLWRRSETTARAIPRTPSPRGSSVPSEPMRRDPTS